MCLGDLSSMSELTSLGFSSSTSISGNLKNLSEMSRLTFLNFDDATE